jgi:hypothetical protein
MSYVPQPSAAGKPFVADTPAERDLLNSALRVAAARAKLELNILESLSINLRQKALSCSEVLARVQREGISLNGSR